MLPTAVAITTPWLQNLLQKICSDIQYLTLFQIIKCQAHNIK